MAGYLRGNEHNTQHDESNITLTELAPDTAIVYRPQLLPGPIKALVNITRTLPYSFTA